MRIYISGPITGTDDYVERFAKAEEELKAAGHQVYNPAHANSFMPEGTTYEEYIEIGFTLLKMADVIYMLDGWEKSRGAKMEYAYALGMGYKVMQQEQEHVRGDYSWSDNPTDEIWQHDRFDSIEACIKDAVAEGKRPGDMIAIGICEDYVPVLDADVMLDFASEDAYEQCGEVAEDWPEFAARKGYKDMDKLQEAIDKVFMDWLRETDQVPSFYSIHPLADMVKIPGAEP